MSFEDYKQKDAIVVVYTGDGKGKTSASLGLTVRALGTGWRVAYIQFIKHWEVGEHNFMRQIQSVYDEKLILFKGGKGFYDAGDISAKNVTEKEHKDAAQETFNFAINAVSGGDYDLVVCDEINNAVNDGLLTIKDLKQLLKARGNKVNLCLTGRNFPPELIKEVDIATEMTKLKHHFDDKYLANKGIDY